MRGTLKSIAVNPNETIKHVKQLVKERSTDSYQQGAQELADLREALGPKRGPARAQKVADQLVAANPTLNLLKSAPRRHALLPMRYKRLLEICQDVRVPAQRRGGKKRWTAGRESTTLCILLKKRPIL